MDSVQDDCVLPQPGCPIRRSPDQRPLSGFPELIAACRVLRRLLAPRHSPCALSSLTMVASIHAEAWKGATAGELPRACSSSHILPVQIVKDRERLDAARHPCARRSLVVLRNVELMGVEPT